MVLLLMIVVFVAIVVVVDVLFSFEICTINFAFVCCCFSRFKVKGHCLHSRPPIQKQQFATKIITIKTSKTKKRHSKKRLYITYVLTLKHTYQCEYTWLYTQKNRRRFFRLHIFRFIAWDNAKKIHMLLLLLLLLIPPKKINTITQKHFF